MVVAVAFWDVASPGYISQTYDNLFHLSAIAHIVDTGQASSLALRTLMEPGKSYSYYPAAWHALAAAVVESTGTSVAVAANAAWIAVVAAVWLPGAAWLAQVLLRGRQASLAALVAVPLAGSFGAMPYALLAWGTLYPTFLATALLPATIAAPVAVWTTRRTLRAKAWPWVALVGVAGTLTLVAAVAFSQPRVLVTWVVLLAPFVAVQAWHAYRAAVRAGGRRRRRARWAVALSAAAVTAVACAGFAYVVFRLGLFERPLDDRLGGPQAQATQSVLDGVLQALSQAWPVGSTGVIASPALLLAITVIGGAAVLWRSRGARWAIVSYGIVIILFAMAAGSDTAAAKLATGLWYKDRYRLSSALPALGVAFATAGVIALSRWLVARSALSVRSQSAIGIVAGWIVALSSAVTLVLSGASAAVGEVFRMPAESASREIISERQIEFLTSLQIPEDERLLGDPWDGAALSLLFGGNTPVFPHVTGQWDEARIALAHRLDDIETDPEICRALDRLRVRYVIYNPHEFGGGDPIGNQFFAIHDAVEAELFTPVRTDGESTLYRIDQCGELPPAMQ
ncbi:hypothetical protein JNB63_05045 [Microbacterium trichothecenolyticum]|nr:hypothetical protein [Microbacterium trichothecenolyticum]